MKRNLPLFIFLTAVILLSACPKGGNVYYGNERGGTLIITNDTRKDMVIFQGWTPNASTILGDIRAQTTKDFALADDVGDYMILRGMSRDTYEANRDNLSPAKIEYSAIVIYGAEEEYHAGFNPDYYTGAAEQITTLEPSSFSEPVVFFKSYRLAGGSLLSLNYPPGSTPMGDFISEFRSFASYSVINMVPNQAIYFTMKDRTLNTQSGYDTMFSHEQFLFNVDSTESGTAKNIGVSLFTDTLTILAYFTGETAKLPHIEKDYYYTLEIRFNGGPVSDTGSYTISFTKKSRWYPS
jgi:hypothetical protein